MPRLVVNPGTDQAWEIQLKPGTNVLGRSASSDFAINDSSVSSSHCQITVDQNGTTLHDLGSTNGTFVDDSPIQESPLESGESVRLGTVEMTFYSDTAERVTVASVQLQAHSAVRLSGVAVETPPIAPPITGAAASGPRFCKFHPKSPARYLCNKCNRAFCEMCVSTRIVGGVSKRMCRSCAVECTPLQPTMVNTAPRSFFAQIPGAFLYPMKGDGAVLLISGTVLYTILEIATHFVAFAMFFGFIALFTLLICSTGYFIGYMRRILTSSATGEDKMPDWPEFSDFGELTGQFFQFLAVVFISFSPAVILAWRAIGYEETWAGIAIIPALCFGCFYLPMGFLAFSMFDSVAAVNPLVVVPAILRVFKEYVVAVIVFAAVLALRWGFNALLPHFSIGSLTTHSFWVLMLILGGTALANFTGIYLFTVNMRVLGLLYLTKRGKLGWFSR